MCFFFITVRFPPKNVLYENLIKYKYIITCISIHEGTINASTRRLSLMQYKEPLFTADAGFSADFWERKLSLYLNIKDIFASNVQKWENTNPYLNTSGSSSSSSRYVSLGLTLRFGKMELESQARKHGGDE